MVADSMAGSEVHVRAGPLEARFRLAAIAESSADAIIGKDLDGVVTAWNAAASALFGYTPEEIVGQPITLIIPPDRLHEEAMILNRVRRGEKVAHYKTECRAKSGEIVPVSLSVSPIRDDSGEIIGISRIARDLSDIHRVRRDLEGREALFSAILEAAPDALIVIDALGLIQAFNASAETMFGFAADEIIGQNISRLMPSPYGEEHDAYLARYARTGEKRVIGKTRTIAGQRRNGETFPMELSVGEVNLPQRQLFAGFVRDLSERRQREQIVDELRSELTHVSRVADLGQMASALAHEVNQPLAALNNYLNAGRRLLGAGRAEDALRATEKASEQADRARQIIQRISAHVKRQQTEKRVEALRSTIEDASSLAMLSTKQSVRLEIHVTEGASEAFIDKIEIQQVLLNLVRNAAEAMANCERRELSIAAARVDDMVEISVADSGPGLSQSVRDRLFQPFVTTKVDGMGVGLSVCRNIIEGHGGRLWAEDGPDGGTVFRFTVPRDQGAAALA
jgi:two-component system sensor kinase FixL